MMDTPGVKKWVQHNFFRKVDSTDTTRGAQDANRPLALSALGKLNAAVLSGIAVLSTLYVDGLLRVRQTGSARYRSDWYVVGAKAYLNAYDDTGAVDLPFSLTCTYFQLTGAIGEAWIPLTYTNGGGTTWADFGGGTQAGQYKKFGDLVFLRGLCTRTAGAGTTIATLPSGYRPTSTHLIGVAANGAFGVIQIDSFGAISVPVGAPWISLDIPPFSVL